MIDQKSQIQQVGPYQVDLSQRIYAEQHENHFEQYACTKEGRMLTAKTIDRDSFSNAAKRKGYQKWNAQVKLVVKASKNDPNAIKILEVVRTTKSYWFFEDYNPQTTIPLHSYLKKGTKGSGIPMLRAT